MPRHVRCECVFSLPTLITYGLIIILMRALISPLLFKSEVEHCRRSTNGRFSLWSFLHGDVERFSQSLGIVFVDWDSAAVNRRPWVLDILRNLSRIHPYYELVCVSAKIPYPPLLAWNDSDSIRLVILERLVEQTAFNWENEFPFDYLLVLPMAYSEMFAAGKDLIWIAERFLREDVVTHNVGSPVIHAFVVGPNASSLACPHFDVNIRTWTLHVTTSAAPAIDGASCQGVFLARGQHSLQEPDYVVGLLIPTSLLSQLPFPFLYPFEQSFLIQAAIRGWAVRVHRYDSPLQSRYKLAGGAWRENSDGIYKDTLASLGIKRIIHRTSPDEGKVVEWFGCTRDTPRCFPSLHFSSPEYLYRGRWTPPCCLEALRRTARHVFKVLDSRSVRWWLEGGSLLGAFRDGDIIPWDYDVDIGIYREDIVKVLPLVKAADSDVLDPDGFKWSKATDGDFYQVWYSLTNSLHVDIFPFHPSSGNMTKDTWFANHPQDCEFPEHFLKPLTRISFVGYNASAPNNIRVFLEYKFGAGVIENPQYPSPSHEDKQWPPLSRSKEEL